MTKIKFTCWPVDEGPDGIRLDIDADSASSLPPCPGLGGWKAAGAGSWWTRLKGPRAVELAAALRSTCEGWFQEVEVVMQGDWMVSATPAALAGVRFSPTLCNDFGLTQEPHLRAFRESGDALRPVWAEWEDWSAAKFVLHDIARFGFEVDITPPPGVRVEGCMAGRWVARVASARRGPLRWRVEADWTPAPIVRAYLTGPEDHWVVEFGDGIVVRGIGRPHYSPADAEWRQTNPGGDPLGPRRPDGGFEVSPERRRVCAASRKFQAMYKAGTAWWDIDGRGPH